MSWLNLRLGVKTNSWAMLKDESSELTEAVGAVNLCMIRSLTFLNQKARYSI
jgi:hypothetical protein